VPENEGEEHTIIKKINEDLARPEETERLQNFGWRKGWDPIGCLEGGMEDLHALERKVLPLVQVPSLAEKVILHRVRKDYPAMAEGALEDLRLVQEACDVVQQSGSLKKVLFMTLQMAGYVKNFGNTDLRGKGFSLKNLQSYTKFKLGKRYDFLFVLSTFLMNLQEQEPQSLTSPPASRSEAAATTTELAVSQRRLSERLRRRRTNERGTSAACAAGRVPEAVGGTPPAKTHFLKQLGEELQPARRAHKRHLTTQKLESIVGQLECWMRFVERCIANEVKLFKPESTSDSPLGLDKWEAQLQAWDSGRQRLRAMHRDLVEKVAELKRCAEIAKQSELSLQKFAALQAREFASVNYLDILGALFTFVDSLKKSWVRCEAQPAHFQDLMRALLTAAPLRLIFGDDCKAEAFKLWMIEEEARMVEEEARQPMMTQSEWKEKIKNQTLQTVFSLFDADGSGKVDKEELCVTIQAFGLVFPEGLSSHLRAVEQYDRDGNGELDFNEFQVWVESRIMKTFLEFLPNGSTEGCRTEADFKRVAEEGCITELDLRRVAEEVSFCDSDIPKDLCKRMIDMFGTSGKSTGGRVTLAEFEKLILMRPSMAGCFSSSCQRNQLMPQPEHARTPHVFT